MKPERTLLKLTPSLAPFDRNLFSAAIRRKSDLRPKNVVLLSFSLCFVPQSSTNKFCLTCALARDTIPQKPVAFSEFSFFKPLNLGGCDTGWDLNHVACVHRTSVTRVLVQRCLAKATLKVTSPHRGRAAWSRIQNMRL